MRDNIENQDGLERLGRIIVVLVVAGVVALTGLSLYVVWKVFV